ncbi:helicase associated domain-containing protein [Streptomyces sp. NPDC001835]|uniref:helicase associated domain-containing protein n=1 Tax=Streptomyces sp. NPDC001835 TaxID=3154528 RepID=UPI0033216F4B
MCEHVLGVEPASEDEKPAPRRSQADKWALNYTAATAARQYYQREGHLRVPRHHIEQITTGGGESGGRHGEKAETEEHHLRLGAWVGNQRSRAASLSPSGSSSWPPSSCDGTNHHQNRPPRHNGAVCTV